MATSTLGASPGVRMSWSEMWTWKAETPARVPAGARISAGKSGRVAVSLPKRRADEVNWVARQLHPVAGVAGEPDHDPVELGRCCSLVVVRTPCSLVCRSRRASRPRARRHLLAAPMPDTDPAGTGSPHGPVYPPATGDPPAPIRAA